MADATLKQIREFFDVPQRPMKLSDFRDEWQNGGLTDEDKAEIKALVGEAVS